MIHHYAVGLILLLAAAPVGGQWIQWGGPRRDFSVEPVSLSPMWPADGPPIRWRRALGDGYSSILVDEDRLYTLYRADRNETIACLNEADGDTIWRHGYAVEPDMQDHPGGYGYGPRATPLIADNRLYATGFNGTLHCLDKRNGAVLWRRELWGEFAANRPRWGYAASPLAWKETIILPVGGRESAVVAFDAATGRTRWQRHDFDNSYASARLIELEERVQLVCFMAREVIGLDPDDGRLLWSHPHENQWRNNVVTPLFSSNGLLFIASEGDGGGRMLRLSLENNETNVKELWHDRRLRISHRNAVRVGDRLMATCGDFGPAFLTAFDAGTGAVAWRMRGFAEAAILHVDGKLLMLEETGRLLLASPTADGVEIHAQSQVLEEPAWAMPTLVGRRLYLRDRVNAMCLELP